MARGSTRTLNQAFVLALVLLISPLVASWAAEKTCYSCHEEAATRFKRKIQHAPVAKQDCEACHVRHGFSNMLILKKEGKELCATCHTDFDSLVAKGAHVHPAVSEGLCATCHDPHASDLKGLMRVVDGDIACFVCHTSLADTTIVAKEHTPFMQRNCRGCHVDHSGALPGLLVSDEHTLCATCHPATATQTLHDAKGLVTSGLVCSDCHDPHRSSQPFLIGANVHQPVSEGMCDACHTGDPVPPSPIGAADSTWAGCSGCHDDISAKLALTSPHAPAAMGECFQCHSAHKSDRDALLKGGAAELCQTCHEDMAAATLAKSTSIHRPVAEGQCVSCHDSHGSNEKALLVKSGDALCTSCHNTEKFTQSHHLQTAGVACSDCHLPHAGSQPALLKESARATCATCHEPELSPTMVAHVPVKQGDCALCHDPHSGPGKSLQRPVPMLCFDCHPNIARFATAGVKHEVAEDCLVCHASHEASNKNLLTKEGASLCADCHEVARDPGAKSVHEPFGKGDCAGCHNPHGSQSAHLLGPRRQMQSTPVGPIVAYPKLDSTSVSLCRTCHADDIEVWQAKTVQHLPARNGECSACHSAHQSPNGHLLSKATSQLCQGCHDPASVPSEPHQGINLASADCAQCHDPHASDQQGLLKSNAHAPFAEGTCDVCHSAPGSVTLTAAEPDLCLACHDDLQSQMSLPVPHAPASGGECTACHNPHTSNEKALLTSDVTSLCRSCHDATAGRHMHAPYESGDCGRCHVPHGSTNPALLVRDANSLCLECHTTLAERLKSETPHAAIKDGCLVCHAGHGSDNASLLKSPPSQLCATCHDTQTDRWRAAHTVAGVDARSSDCMSCHDPHTSPPSSTAMLKRSQHAPFEGRQCDACHEAGATSIRGDRALCGQCHDETVAAIGKMPVVHAAMADSAACMTCHSPHVGDTKALLRKSGFSVCMDCHETINLTAPVVHAPAREDCANCHTPHGGDDPSLLVEKDAMALCQRCHEDATKTHFHPMGDNTKDEKNRGMIVCTSCHSPHNSEQKALLLGDPGRGLCVRCHDPSASHEGG